MLFIKYFYIKIIFITLNKMEEDPPFHEDRDTIVDMSYADLERIHFSKKDEFLRFSQLSMYQIERSSLIELVNYIQFKRHLDNKDKFRVLVQVFFDRYMDLLSLQVPMLEYIFNRLGNDSRSYFLNPIALILGLFVVYQNEHLRFEIHKSKIEYLIDIMDVFEQNQIQMIDIIKYARFWIQNQ